MALKDVLQFWQRVQTDTDFQRTLSSVRDCAEEERAGAVATIAQQAGFHITPDELTAMESAVAFWERVEEDSDLRTKLEPAAQLESEEEAHSILRTYEECKQTISEMGSRVKSAREDNRRLRSILSDAQRAEQTVVAAQG